jgi:hypothetical protein
VARLPLPERPSRTVSHLCTPSFVGYGVQGGNPLKEFSGKELLGAGTAVLFVVVLIQELGSKM